ncbi:MFS transporter, putative [Bodo saltans]|uniref:MFS transporter, putative n=1 Tax=Bodo saltans TaxID=75058 RepID=A0A0S4IUZ9_BODSA|nr:MFS transporter, putative [Bodo saltans]|eukprot:CUF96084.1 MFS transporter, putative [Bodo saltans]
MNGILILVCAQYALISCLQSALFPVVLQSVQSYLDTSNAKMAALVSLYDIIQVFASLPCASASRRLGCLHTLALGGATSCFGALLFAVSTGYSGLALAQLLMGVGASTVTVLAPHIMTLIAVSPHQASAFLSWSYASASVGVVVGYILAGIVGPDQWRLLFLLNAAGVVPVAALLWFTTEPNRVECTVANVVDMSQQEGGGDAIPPNAIEKGTTDDNGNCTGYGHLDEVDVKVPGGTHGEDVVELMANSDMAHALKSVQAIATNRVVVFTILSQSCIGFGLAALIAFIPKYISGTLGESQSTTSILMATTVPATAAGVLISGHVAQKYSLTARQLSQVLLACCGGSLLLSVMFQISQVVIFTLLLIVDMMLVFGSMVPSVMIFPQILKQEHVPFANALSNTSIRLLGSVNGPLVLGMLLDVYGSSGTTAVQMCYTAVSIFSMGLAVVFAALSLQSQNI